MRSLNRPRRVKNFGKDVAVFCFTWPVLTVLWIVKESRGWGVIEYTDSVCRTCWKKVARKSEKHFKFNESSAWAESGALQWMQDAQLTFSSEHERNSERGKGQTWANWLVHNWLDPLHSSRTRSCSSVMCNNLPSSLPAGEKIGAVTLCDNF